MSQREKKQGFDAGEVHAGVLAGVFSIYVREYSVLNKLLQPWLFHFNSSMITFIITLPPRLRRAKRINNESLW